MQKDLTKGNVTKSMMFFAGPMIAGNLLQQLYNITDTLIVGKLIGAHALAAVGASFTLMAFLTSILLGLCMGSGVVFSMLLGGKREEELKNSFFISFVLIGATALLINVLALFFLDPILLVLQIPEIIRQDTRDYLQTIFYGIGFLFLYNYFAALLRGIGNSVVPLLFLVVSTVLNIGLDLLFVLTFEMGVSGAALATVIAQGVSAILITFYCLWRVPILRLEPRHMRFEPTLVRSIAQYSLLTCVQQSIMNFGILLIQGLVNSFGVAVMAAFAAAVKIDAFAYMPTQDFGNAFSTFIAQNFGAKESARIRQGTRAAVRTVLIFCAVVSVVVFVFAERLMLIFIEPKELEIIAIGVKYLRIEGACYCGIGCLFLFYGLYRGMGRPWISIVLTVASLGTRVALAYLLAPIPAIGLLGIWWAIPVGWFLADAIGLYCYKKVFKALDTISIEPQPSPNS